MQDTKQTVWEVFSSVVLCLKCLLNYITFFKKNALLLSRIIWEWQRDCRMCFYDLSGEQEGRVKKQNASLWFENQ